MSKQAIILAAGAGNRAKPFTSSRPKCMFEVANKPLLHRAIDALIDNGIRDIIIVVGYRKELIFDYLSEHSFKNVTIKTIEQKKLLGSCEALINCSDLLSDKDFVVLPADKYYTAETLKPIIDASAPTMLTQNPNLPIYATARNTNGQLAIGRFEHALDEDPIDTRIYALNKKYFKYMQAYSSINQAFNNLKSENININYIPTNGIWADLLFPWDLLTINELALKENKSQTLGKIGKSVSLIGNIYIGANTEIGANSSITGNTSIGCKCQLMENTVIKGSTSIGNSSIIEPFCYISNSIIGKNVHISAGCVINNSIIDDNTFIGPRFTNYSDTTDIKNGNDYYTQNVGSMIGCGVSIGANVFTEPGTIIGNNVKITNNKILNGIISDGVIVR